MADRAYDMLEKVAQGVQQDIQDTYPELDDNGYDLWVEELRHTGTGNRTTYGVVDMGEWKGVYTWDGASWDSDHTEDPYEILQRIIRHRSFKERSR